MSVCEASAPASSEIATPLIVRLPNHLGDACMTLPALDLLADNGYSPTLVGRSWIKDLFSAYPWPVLSLRGSRVDRVKALRNIKGAAGLLLTNSFSTALKFRLAGIPALGYARDGRSWLLRKAREVDASDHMVEYYYRLASSLVGTSFDVPRDLRLRINDNARERTHNLLSLYGVTDGYIVLCPVAVGAHRGKAKAWDGFSRLNADLLASGMQVVAMPGPRETTSVVQALPGAIVLPESDVAMFAAVLAGATLVVANDSGSGHLAAAVGARLVSIFGVTEPEKTRPWSSRARVVGSGKGWPSYDAVRTAIDSALRD